ncbi:4'-phosphopantetheinyl transferase superfamily protein, partial [Kocuria sp. 2SI]|uniref:4'-phosphopantetheinyl transferase superfamily protein n=1 Tax=Kocuria sp. 2SI TaxID=2502203 RepID=UPI00201E5DF1
MGIDVEPNDGLPNGTLELIASPVEISGLRALDSLWPKVAWDRLLFSAKEAIFKAWFPMTGHWLNYHECTLTIESDTATFTGRLHLDSSIRAHFGIDMVEGRWGISKGRGLTPDLGHAESSTMLGKRESKDGKEELHRRVPSPGGG